MTKKEYENLLETEEGREKIIDTFGTSGVYKAIIPFPSFNKIDLDEIIYIPENGFEYLDNGELNVDELCVYTAKDLIEMFNGNVGAAEVLFNTLDWQFPGTLFDEEYDNGEIKYCSQCDQFFYDYDNKNCRICDTRYENADNDY